MHFAMVIALAFLLAAAAQAFVVYPATPRAAIDGRLAAYVDGQPQGYPLEVQNAPAKPLTRDPGFGRPPLPSSRLRLATSSAVQITLRCAGGGIFANVSDVRGVGFNTPAFRRTSNAPPSTATSVLSFSLPAPCAEHPSAHYYLKATIVGGQALPPGVNASQLFLFWLDLPVQPEPNHRAVTTMGVAANSSKAQTSAIQRAIDVAARARATLYFPAGYYRSGVLFLRSHSRLELAPGTLLQMPAPSDADFVQPTGAPTGCPSDFAFIEIQNATDVSLRGGGATLDAHGFPGHALCVSNSSRVSVSSLLIRQPASWNTHIFRSSHVQMTGVKLFSGADGFDPDCSQDVTIDSVFVHSNDDAFAVKAVHGPGLDTERVVMSHALISTKKSAMKVGTESVSNIRDILFTDIEAFDIDRGLVMYPSDGGQFESIRWQRVRISSFLPYHDEPEPENKAGTWLDFAVKHRGGLSQMSNITAHSVEVHGVCGSANIKGTPGALVQNTAFTNLTLAVASPLPSFTSKEHAKPWLISCSGGADNQTVSFSGLAVSYASAADQAQWSGIQPTPGCVKLEEAYKNAY